LTQSGHQHASEWLFAQRQPTAAGHELVDLTAREEIVDIPSAQEVTTNWLYRSAIMPTNNMVHEALIRPTSATSQITPSVITRPDRSS
jgi:hypothetical protein